jgi:hypothetical protein
MSSGFTDEKVCAYTYYLPSIDYGLVVLAALESVLEVRILFLRAWFETLLSDLNLLSRT